MLIEWTWWKSSWSSPEMRLAALLIRLSPTDISTICAVLNRVLFFFLSLYFLRPGECCHIAGLSGCLEKTYPFQTPTDSCSQSFVMVSLHLYFANEPFFCWLAPSELRKNLQGLVTPSSSGPAHPSKFWKWLDRQPWRRMLPAPFEFPGSTVEAWLKHGQSKHGLTFACAWGFLLILVLACLPCCHLTLRVEVVLTNPGRVSQNFLGTWELMLPSDVLLGLQTGGLNSCP